jgi:hypothetical protein
MRSRRTPTTPRTSPARTVRRTRPPAGWVAWTAPSRPPAGSDAGGQAALSTALDRLHRSIAGLERRLENADCPDASASLDPELVHKVMHACIESDDISSSEEIVILRRLLGES